MDGSLQERLLKGLGCTLHAEAISPVLVEAAAVNEVDVGGPVVVAIVLEYPACDRQRHGTTLTRMV